MSPESAARWLVLSASFAMLVACLVGVVMLVPTRRSVAGGGYRRGLLSAHLDWIMLGLMEGLAAALCVLFTLRPAPWVIGALIFGAWANPLPYVFRAFGVDAFRFAGGAVQRLSATLGALSSLAIMIGWIALLWPVVKGTLRPW